jgi:hypothetical protein
MYHAPQAELQLQTQALLLATETVFVTHRSGWALSRAENGNARIEAVTEAFWTGDSVLRIPRLLHLFWGLDRLLIVLRFPSQPWEVVVLDLGPTLLVVWYLDQPDRFSLEVELEGVAVVVADHPPDRRALSVAVGLLDGDVAEVVGVVVLVAVAVLVVHEVAAAVLAVDCSHRLHQM